MKTDKEKLDEMTGYEREIERMMCSDQVEFERVWASAGLAIWVCLLMLMLFVWYCVEQFS